MTVSLAVVVCSRDRPQQLRECLRTVVAQDADDIVVVDSASTTAATAEAAGEAGVRCIRADVPGLAHARNVAMRATGADVVAFTDDDCQPEPGWARAIRSQFVAGDGVGERVGFVVGRVVAAGGGEPVSVVLDAFPRTYGADDDPSHIGHGANLAVSRACWDSLGGFDDMLGVGAELRSGEDTDFLWRALREGWIGRYDPHAAVSHEQWRDRRAALATSYGYGVGAGAVRTKVRRLGGSQAARDFAAGSVRATLRQAGTDLRAGYEFGFASSVMRAVGLIVGRTTASRLPLVHGHLTPR
ncbi:MAG: glycosyltransferase [Frankiaceae bacterium]|nr:glycosyltransferase [Frankiaceae bacterium]MBV9871781.1 glycosyltransferase [Frankiaceae bacterium]